MRWWWAERLGGLGWPVCAGREKEITYRKPYVTIGVGKKEEMLLGRWIFFLVLCPILPFLLLLLGFDRGSEWEGENINGFFPSFFRESEDHYEFYLIILIWVEIFRFFFVLLLRFLLLLCRSSLRALVGGDDDVSVSAEWLETFFCCFFSYFNFSTREREVRRLSEIFRVRIEIIIAYWPHYATHLMENKNLSIISQ